MTNILQIIASPRGTDSQSTQVANTYIEARTRIDPQIKVDVLDLWRTPLPEFDGDKAAAKMTFFGVGEMDQQRLSAWDQVVAICERFSQADEYVISVPMWNGGVPYKLKHYIDLITQPGLLFGFDPAQGYFGLLENKTATVVYTSGVFAPGAPAKYGSDFQSSYLAWWLGTIGITDVKPIRYQPSLLTEDPAAQQQAAISQAKQTAEQFTAAAH
ncbi:FMN-dependent NADH-azoreductase [Halioxenophilus aromaticivorans]|uniref:FMN dependent NADH:quinone oxidoreductase n=1 Tax=Halioxenophilus aromaticivorans TaxID=1306992 RepID=A0AAV3U0B2_9ALTE